MLYTRVLKTLLPIMIMPLLAISTYFFFRLEPTTEEDLFAQYYSSN